MDIRLGGWFSLNGWSLSGWFSDPACTEIANETLTNLEPVRTGESEQPARKVSLEVPKSAPTEKVCLEWIKQQFKNSEEGDLEASLFLGRFYLTGLAKESKTQASKEEMFGFSKTFFDLVIAQADQQSLIYHQALSGIGRLLLFHGAKEKEAFEYFSLAKGNLMEKKRAAEDAVGSHEGLYFYSLMKLFRVGTDETWDLEWVNDRINAIHHFWRVKRADEEHPFEVNYKLMSRFYLSTVFKIAEPTFTQEEREYISCHEKALNLSTKKRVS